MDLGINDFVQKRRCTHPVESKTFKLTWNHVGSFDSADSEPCDVIVTGLVQTRHLRRLATNQRAARLEAPFTHAPHHVSSL